MSSWPSSRAVASVLALWSLAGSAHALDPGRHLYEYAHQIWRSDEGLPQNSVEALAQTRDGYLWVGTQEGVARFNGRTFAAFDRARAPLLPSNHVTALLLGRDDRLWIGTFGGAVFRRGRQFVKLDALSIFSEHKVLAFAEARDGTVWIGSEVGLARLSADGLVRYTTQHGLPSNVVRTLAIDQENAVWIGTDQGLARHRAGHIESFAQQAGAPTRAVLALAAGPQGGVWVGGESGLVFWNGRQFVPRGVGEGGPAGSVRALLLDRQGALWAGTSGGLARLWRERWEWFAVANGLSAHVVSALLEDQEGSLWIGTSSGGLNRLMDGQVVVHGTLGGLASEVAYVVTGDGHDGLWIGSEDGDVDHLRASDGLVTHLATRGPLGGARVRALLADRQGTLWVGSEGGLFRVRGQRIEAIRDPALPRDTIRAVTETRAGEIWVGTERSGIVRLAGGRWSALTGLPSDEIRAIFEDRANRIWIGTNAGLCEWRGWTCKTYTVADGLAHDFVRAFHEDAAGTLWIGTYGGGLSRLENGRLASFDSSMGLLSDAIYAIVEDGEGNLWMSCNRGVFGVAKRELAQAAGNRRFSLKVAVLGREDGMASSECNGGNPAAWATADGRLWFPTLRGVVEVDPARIRPSTLVPPTVIEEVLADGAAVDLDRPVHLAPGTRRLDVHYAAVNLRASERIRYRYRLLGFDRNWVEAGAEGAASYTPLKPGRYTFQARACNSDGIWDETGAALPLVVEPYLHQRVWFVPAMVVLGLALLAGAYTVRMRSVAERERRLQTKIQEARAEIKVLSGLLPICSGCKNIRDDQGYWNQLEDFLHQHAEVEFSHGLCPDCVRRLYPEYADAVLTKTQKPPRPPASEGKANAESQRRASDKAAGDGARPGGSPERSRARKRSDRRPGGR